MINKNKQTSLFIYPTYVCSNNCNFCFIDPKLRKRSNDLSLKDKQFVINLHEIANKLCRKYKIRLLLTGVAPLKKIYFKPAIKSTLFKLPLKWKFKLDPKDTGLDKKWYKNNAALKWDSIKTNKDWTSQGHHYHGAAWYAVKFVLPKNVQEEIKKNKIKPAIYFGAVDGTADLFLNGIKMGEQKQSASFMWDKSFAVALPDNFNPEIENELVVRVKKDKYAAGIWKPVSIVSLSETSLSETKVSSVELHKPANAVNSSGKESSSCTGWAKIGYQYIKKFKSISADGSFQFYFQGMNGGCIYYKFPTVAGKTYRITYDIKVTSGVCYVIAFTDTEHDPLKSMLSRKAFGKSNDFRKESLYFKATTSESCLGFRLAGGSEGIIDVYIDNISIRALSEK